MLAFRRGLGRRVRRHPLLVPALATVVVAAVAGVVHPARAGAARSSALPKPRVTLIGDSVASSISYDKDAQAILGQGIDLQLQLAPCRRVGQSSCPYGGVRPPTVVDLVPTLGQALGANVIVAVGYNDFESAYAGNIDDALSELRQAGVTRVLWATLREERDQYVSMNDDIRAAAARHPEMTVVDWNLYSRSHPDWFQADGLHLVAAGTEAMATLFHKALVDLGIPVTPPNAPFPVVTIPTVRLPVATAGKPYAVRLSASGGKRPLRWSRVGGTFPTGLNLRSDGRIRGVPRKVGTFRALIKVTDATGSWSTARYVLRVKR
jgi:hypothetical protein